MALFPSSRDEMVDDLKAQVASLSKELTKLRKIASKHGSAAYDEASAGAQRAYNDLSAMAADYAPYVRKSARDLERRARANPAATAAIGIVAIGVLAALLSRRSD